MRKCGFRLKKFSGKTKLEKLIKQVDPIYDDYNKKKAEFELAESKKEKYDALLSLEFSKRYKKDEINNFYLYVQRQLSGIDQAEVTAYIKKYNEERFDLIDIKQYILYRDKFFSNYEQELKSNINSKKVIKPQKTSDIINNKDNSKHKHNIDENNQ